MNPEPTRRLEKTATSVPTSKIATLTYEELLTEYHRTHPEVNKYSRTDRYALKNWLLHIKKDFASTIGTELAWEFAKRINAFGNKNKNPGLGPKTRKNLANRISTLHLFYLELMSPDGIPVEFFDALEYCVRRAGLTKIAIYSKVPTADHWFKRRRTPNTALPNTVAGIKKIEEMLNLKPDTLLSRATQPMSSAKLPRLEVDLPFRRYAGVMQRTKYAIMFRNMNPDLQSDINELIEHKKISEHVLPDGDITVLKAKQTWNTADTVDQRMQLITKFFGFLAMPKVHPLPTDWFQAVHCGLGLPPESLRLHMLANKAYLFGFMKYTQLRSFDRDHFIEYEQQTKAIAAGELESYTPITARKTVPASFIVLARAASNLVNRPYSFLRIRPEMGLLMDPPVPESEWEAWCLKAHAGIRAVIRTAEKLVQYNKRSNKEVAADILREENPSQVYHTLIQRMKDDMPPDLNPSGQARLWQEITMLELLLFDPLRVKNIRLLKMGQHIYEKDGKVWMHIRASEFKNFIHGHAETRLRALPDNVAETMRAWLNVYRPKLAGAGKSNWVFMRTMPYRGKKPRDDIYVLSGVELSKIIGDVTGKYFGLRIGPHAIRNIVSSTIARHGGSPTQIKAILNDSEAVAMTIYRDIKNEDEFKKLDDIYALTSKKGGPNDTRPGV